MSKTKTKYTLKYFDVRGRGELIRLLFEALNIDYEDQRFDMESWPTEKPKVTFKQLPVLMADGVEMTESVAIAGYIAREHGIYGSTNMEQYRNDEIVGITRDLLQAFVKAFFEKDPDRKAAAQKELKDKIPFYLGNIEKLVSANKTEGYSFGNKLSLADVAILDITEGMVEPATVAKYKAVNAIVTRVKSIGRVSQYLANRKQTPV